MTGFLGSFGSHDTNWVRGVLDAPCLFLGKHAFCGEGAAEADGTVALLSGRLKNAARLKAQLEQSGARLPAGASDSQLLLAAYRLWETDCYAHLQGPVCMAVVDPIQDRLILARDPMGEGRIFYAERPQGVFFASRAEWLLGAPGVEPRIDGDGLREIFALGPARTPGRTPFAHIRELENGCMLICDGRGCRVSRYFRLEPAPHRDSPAKTVDTVRGMLEEIISSIKSLSPVCMLSGGLDSTLLTALLAPEGGAVSFSVDYADNDRYFQGGSRYQGSEDAPWVRQASEALHSRHEVVLLPQTALAEALIEAGRARDFPGMADVDSSLLLFARVLSTRSRCALSGECGDEVFGGYPWFQREELIASDLFPWSGSLPLRTSILAPALRQRLDLPGYARQQYHEAVSRLPVLPGESPKDARLRQIQGLCFQFFMPNLQERALRMGQACGLTLITPYADETLAQYVYNVPWEIKNMGGMEKGLLRAAARGLLPDGLRMRKKSPYPKTYHPEFGRTVARMCMETLRKKDSPLSPLLDMEQVERLAGSALSPRDMPWFGQLMTLPQMLGYLIQTDDFLRRTGAQVEI